MPTLLVLGAAAAALAVAGCGGGGGGSTTASVSSTPAASSTPAQTTAGGGSASGGAGSTVKLTADASGQLAFDNSSASAKAGKVTLTMSNPAPLPHGIAIEGGGVDKSGSVVQKGGTSTVTVTLKPGKYTYYCPVPGHRQGGMQGTLTVQ